MLIVPPGGFAGLAQQTPVAQKILTTGSRMSSGRRRRRKSSKRAKSTTRKARKSGGGRKLKFGSPAWRKKYAAKAKRNRRKKK